MLLAEGEAAALAWPCSPTSTRACRRPPWQTVVDVLQIRLLCRQSDLLIEAAEATRPRTGQGDQRQERSVLASWGHGPRWWRATPAGGRSPEIWTDGAGQQLWLQNLVVDFAACPAQGSGLSGDFDATHSVQQARLVRARAQRGQREFVAPFAAPRGRGVEMFVHEVPPSEQGPQRMGPKHGALHRLEALLEQPCLAIRGPPPAPPPPPSHPQGPLAPSNAPKHSGKASLLAFFVLRVCPFAAGPAPLAARRHWMAALAWCSSDGVLTDGGLYNGSEASHSSASMCAMAWGIRLNPVAGIEVALSQWRRGGATQLAGAHLGNSPRAGGNQEQGRRHRRTGLLWWVWARSQTAYVWRPTVNEFWWCGINVWPAAHPGRRTRLVSSRRADLGAYKSPAAWRPSALWLRRACLPQGRMEGPV